MPERFGNEMPGLCIPDPGTTIGTGRGQQMSVWAPFNVPDLTRVVHGPGQKLAGGSVPDASGPEFGGGDNRAAIRAKAGPQNGALVPKRREDRLARVGVPELCRVVR